MKNHDEDEAAVAGPRRRRVVRSALAAFASMAALVMAAPAQAAAPTPMTATNSLHIDDVFAAVTAATAPYSYSYVQVTYTCTVASGITRLGVTAVDGGVIQGIYTGYTSVTCDGTSHKMTFRGGAGTPGMTVGGTFCLVNATNNRVVTTNWSGTMANPPAVMPRYVLIQNKTGVAACG